MLPSENQTLIPRSSRQLIQASEPLLLQNPNITYNPIETTIVPTSKMGPYLITYLLTPRSRILLEKLTGSQLVKKLPAFYGTRKFITSFKNENKIIHQSNTTFLLCCYIHKCLPPFPVLSQLVPDHVPSSQFLKMQLNIIFLSTPGSSK